MNQQRYRFLFTWADVLIIVLLAAVPLFITFPYRVNIFLSWEGAYRISEGQVPFRDFGAPMGGFYWVIPGIFFKLFGAQMITLVKAQVFINIIGGLAFRSILKTLGMNPLMRIMSVLLFCISYSFFNFWPWYNHTVIVYELIAIAFLLKGIFAAPARTGYGHLVTAGFFAVFSFFTKQDAGAIAILLCGGLALVASIKDKVWSYVIIYGVSVAVVFAGLVAYFGQFEFGYWFNHGQAPHSSRISLFEIADELLASSQWLKFYIFLTLLVVVMKYKSWKSFWASKNEILFLLLTLGILGEAAIFQVTSYTPPDNNIFFHAFAIAFLLYHFSSLLPANIHPLKLASIFTIGLLFWWSGVFWKYIQRFAEKILPHDAATISPTGENVVNKQTYMIYPADSLEISMGNWVSCGLKSFDKITMPPSTADGIKRLMELDLIKQHKNLKVLNMTELTPLAVEIPYQTERGAGYPLWNHLGVAMFNKQAAFFEKRIADKYYDLILFEYIPTLNNFYPFRTRDTLLQHYQKIDSFAAPRRGDTKGMIEVYGR